MLRTSVSKVVNRRLTPCTSPTRLKSLRFDRDFKASATQSASYRRFGESRESQSSTSRDQRLEEQRLRFPASHSGPASVTPIQSLYQRLAKSSGGGRGSGRSRFGGRPPVLIIVAVGVAGVYYVFHLEKVPETGRWRFIDVGPAQERQIGDETFRQTLAEYKDRILPGSHPLSRQVRSVASRIVAAIDKSVENQPNHTHGDSAFDHGREAAIRYGSANSTSSSDTSPTATNWQVFVIDDPKQKNAFVLPGGKIFVFTGILPICDGDDGLATVLGHEVAHQVARHSAEKMSGYKILLFGTVLLDVLGLDIGLSRAALTLLLSLPNSRKTELEADYLGLRIMSRACYDPREASKLWTRMSESEGGSTGGILSSAQALLSTHPVSSQRIKNMQKWLPEAMSIRESNACPPSQQVSGFRRAMGGPSPFQ